MTAVKSARRKPKPASEPQSATAAQILDLAETLIQTRSYSAFSYQDIADALGIRKASIHYHFPSKTDLGEAVVTRDTERIAAALAAITRDESKSTAALFDFYVTLYVQFGHTPDRVCLCGALAGEMLALPAEMRACVERFFKSHQAWLAKILERGAARGEITLAAPVAKVARLVFAALQGALLVKRTTADVSQLDDVILALQAQLALPGAGRRAGAGATTSPASCRAGARTSDRGDRVPFRPALEERRKWNDPSRPSTAACAACSTCSIPCMRRAIRRCSASSWRPKARPIASPARWSCSTAPGCATA